MAVPRIEVIAPSMTADARSIGPIALRALARAGQASVIARFDRSFYLETGNQCVCVVEASLPDGPLNLRLARGPAAAALLTWASVGQSWTISADRLFPSDRPEGGIWHAAAQRWCPALPAAVPASAFPAALGGRRLRHHLLCRKRPPSFLDLVLDPMAVPKDMLRRVALRRLHGVRSRIPDLFDAPSPALALSVNSLLGLGPGLTPSGDDVIAGLLIACHQIGQGRLGSALWARIRADAAGRTNSISLAHLAAAGEGMGAAPLHDLINAVIDNRPGLFDNIMDAIAEIGHASGWDGIGGALLLLEGWSERV